MKTPISAVVATAYDKKHFNLKDCTIYIIIIMIIMIMIYFDL